MDIKVSQIEVKVYLLKDITIQDSLQEISKLIDKGFYLTEDYPKFHEKNDFKNYSFNSLWPIEPSKIYKEGKIYTFIIRTVDENLAMFFEKTLSNLYTESIKVLTTHKKILIRKHINKLYSITPVIAKFDTGYWRNNTDISIFEKRLKDNLIKKYNSYYNTTINEDFDLFNLITFQNKKPISSSYKNIHILGDKISMEVCENSSAQDLAFFAMGSGLLEMNPRGYGYVNAKWL
ncbi:CRISPR-associated endoribonuclease Cas6 [Clostridium algidicarnis]|uniref:CRISPR-associated endoribonuclease Cas6 n=1 Tax=Clostridium algidicarnis TaxID=37659 RepID=UPI001FE8BA3F|nr:CRISPR-associated endoribonuclease Cas6 [Clostridium algidicarnis]